MLNFFQVTVCGSSVIARTRVCVCMCVRARVCGGVCAARARVCACGRTAGVISEGTHHAVLFANKLLTDRNLPMRHTRHTLNRADNSVRVQISVSLQCRDAHLKFVRD
jgi:hypothetical protein